MFGINAVEKIKPHIKSQILFFFENLVLYKTMTRNTKE